ncbi:hypothetical protein APHAL10511_008727 [Amanita phalloides]|nr:hypothetical protein APHAL10511_008727 [Amanita phalloides]
MRRHHRKDPEALSEVTYIPESIRTPNAIVHLQYEYRKEPAKPSHQGQWTRFVCLSDTHSRVCPVPDGDVLLHSGDLTNSGVISEVRDTMEWLCGLNHKVKIIIAGNHDLTFDREWYEANWTGRHWVQEDENAIMELVKGPAAKEAGIVYLDCEKYQFSVEEGGKMWSVYGSPWQPEFCNWAFNYKRNRAHVIVDKIPKVDILLTHGPPYGVLDETKGKLKVGCETLAKRLPQLQPRLHLFGHIHEAHGAHIHTWDNAKPTCPIAQSYHAIKNTGNAVGPQTVFVNASNLSYPSYGRNHVPFGGPGFQPVIIFVSGDHVSLDASGNETACNFARSQLLPQAFMGAVQSFVTSTEGGVIVAATLVFVGAVEYSTYRTSKQLERGFEKDKGKKGDGKEKGREDKKKGAIGDAFDATKARKKKGKKHATAAQTITSSAAEASPSVTATTLPIPGDFDTASKIMPKSKNKTKARITSVSASAHTGDGEDETSSATPNEAPSRPPASASGTKPKKSKKKKKLVVGASASTSTLTLPETSSSKTTLSASNPAAIQPSAVLTSTPPTKDPAVRVKGTDALVSRGSRPKDALHSEEGSATDDEGKPFLASLSSSRQETMGHSRVLGIPIGASSVYPDTDSSWTHVQRGSRNNNSSSGPGQLSTSDAGVVSSVTDDGYPSSSPVAERAEDTEEEEEEEEDTLQTQTQGLGLGSAYVRASEGSDDGSKNNNAPRKTLPDMQGAPGNLNPSSHVVRRRPPPSEKPASGFSWADYEDVHVDEGAGHDADGEDDGWGVVKSRRSRLDRGSSSTGAGTPAGDAGAGASQVQKENSILTKKQRQNAKKREATKAAKAEAEAERLAILVKHKQQLERAKTLEQISKSSSKVPSGGMKAAVDGNGKLIWE